MGGDSDRDSDGARGSCELQAIDRLVYTHPMEKRVRIGTLADQDRWRREDLAARTPSERVDMLLDLQRRYYGARQETLVRVATVGKLRDRST
jgi:hypothetical protein